MTTFSVTILCHIDGQPELACVGQHLRSGQLSRYSDSLPGRSGDRIPVEAKFSAPVQTGPGIYPASYTKGNRSFPGLKRPERGVEHSLPPSSTVVEERVGLYLCSPSGPSWPYSRENFCWTTFKKRSHNLQVPCVLYIGQAFRYSPENAFYILINKYISLSDICLTEHH